MNFRVLAGRTERRGRGAGETPALPRPLPAQVFWICLPRPPRRETKASVATSKARHKGPGAGQVHNCPVQFKRPQHIAEHWPDLAAATGPRNRPPGLSPCDQSVGGRACPDIPDMALAPGKAFLPHLMTSSDLWSVFRPAPALLPVSRPSLRPASSLLVIFSKPPALIAITLALPQAVGVCLCGPHAPLPLPNIYLLNEASSDHPF